MIARAQGWYYLGGGLWRLLHPRSFERIAGPKPDQFQTDVAAALFAAIGATLVVDSLAGPRSKAPAVLAVGSASAIAAIDLKHRRQIRSLFIIEAASEIAMAVAAASTAAQGPPAAISRVESPHSPPRPRRFVAGRLGEDSSRWR